MDIADEEVDVVTAEEIEISGSVASTNDGEEDNDVEKDEEGEGDEEYEVEKILNKKKDRSKKTLYLIRWKGYSPSHDTWEPEENLADAQDALNAFLEVQENSKKKGGVKRSAKENSRTPKRVKSFSPDSVKNGEMSGEEDDDDFKIEETPKKRNNKQSNNGRGTRASGSATKKQQSKTPNKLSSSDSRVGTRNSQSSIKNTVESRIRNNKPFPDWLIDSDDEDNRRSASEVKNVNDNDIKKDENKLELKLNTSEENEEEKVIITDKIEDGKINNLLAIDSPPPPTDPEENGETNNNITKEKKDLSALSRRRSTTSESKNNVVAVNNVSNKETIQNGKQQKKNSNNKKENEESVDFDNDKDEEKPLSSEFHIDVMFRDNIGKLKLVANMGTLSECQITINAQLEKELASFLKTKIKPGSSKKANNKQQISDDSSSDND